MPSGIEMDLLCPGQADLGTLFHGGIHGSHPGRIDRRGEIPRQTGDHGQIRTVAFTSSAQ